MSYYESNYYRNPGPVYPPGGDKMEPVLGWGPNPIMAGAAYVGIGQDPILPTMSAEELAALERLAKLGQKPRAPADNGAPWWVWPLGATLVLGGLGYYGTNKGWF